MTLIYSQSRARPLRTARETWLTLIWITVALGALRFVAQAATNPPAIVAQPQSVSQINGFPAWFTLGATGAPPLAYQWRRSGTNLAGATNIAYGWSAIQPGLAGSYDVVVTNSSGSVTSAVAMLTVLASTASCSLTNLRLVPLNELGAGTHKGYAGGLYPGGLNYRPRAHDEPGRNLARTVIVRRNAAATDVSLFIEESDDLATWKPAGMQIAILENTPSVLRWRLNDPISAAPHRFLRISAETR